MVQIFLLPVFLMSCAHLDGVSVLARSAGYEIDTSKTIAIYDDQYDEENLINYDNRKKIIDACYQTAKSKNLKFERLSETANNPDVKYIAFFSYDISSKDYQTNVPTYTTPVQTNCYKGAYGIVNCTSSGGNVYGGYSVNQTIFTKLLDIEIFNIADLDKKNGKPKAIKQIRAVVSSQDAAMKPATANVLCKAALVDFPNNIDNTEYTIVNPESPIIEQTKK
jgi:hypothetical protein